LGTFPNPDTQFKPGNPGRPVGAPQVSARRAGKLRKAVAIIEAIEQKPMRFEGTALQLLQMIYRDERLPMDVRGAAAKSALPYESPSIGSVTAASLSVAVDKSALVDDPRPALRTFLSEFRAEEAVAPLLPADEAVGRLALEDEPDAAEAVEPDEDATDGPPLPRATAADVEYSRAQAAVDRVQRAKPSVQTEDEAEQIRAAWANAFPGRRDLTVHSDGV